MNATLRLLDRLIALPQTARRALLVVLDATLAALALWAAYAIRFESLVPDYLLRTWWLLPTAAALTPLVNWRLGIYHSLLRHSGSEAAYRVGASAVVVTLALLAIDTFGRSGSAMPRMSVLLFALLLGGLMGGARMLARDLTRRALRVLHRTPVVIYGAGGAGIGLATALERSETFAVVAFLDDSGRKHGTEIRGLRVYPPSALGRLVRDDGVAEVFIAIPSATRADQRRLARQLAEQPVKIRSVPSLEDILSGRRSIEDTREIGVTELLERSAVNALPALLERAVRGRRLMVTGAGGSIGSELARQIVSHGPETVVLVDASEFALYAIERELREAADAGGAAAAVRLAFALGNVLDRDRMAALMRRHRIDAVYHAAAYKHVPIVERDPAEGVRNNALGTLQTAQAARDAGVARFVLVSTDKAVRPTNVMGASKRLAEMVIQALAQEGGVTVFSAVRFGNVLGSSGSVVPLFQAQIAAGGPVTVTHPEVTRYFMTIPEAASLVIQAGEMAEGGDVFLLDMGEPVRIVDLARRMIRLAGLTERTADRPDGDIEIAFTGLRPGEKLYEELLIDATAQTTEHPMIRRAVEEHWPWARLEPLLAEVARGCDAGDAARIGLRLGEAVAGYSPGAKQASGPFDLN